MLRANKNKWSRRRFLSAAAWMPVTAFCPPMNAAWSSPTVNTVLGSVPAGDLGITLVHEHVLVDFVGADQIQSGRYDADEVFRVVLPYLTRIRDLGCRTLVDCTPEYLGRDPLLLRRLSQAAALNLITNTGFYGAGGGKYLPRHVREQSADDIAAHWIDEFRRGIAGTGIKPGFIKIGVNKGHLDPIDAKLVHAAARAHKETGMTIACHTGDGEAALEEVRILEHEGVSPSALIWVHAQNGTAEVRERLARAGVWIELDNVNDKTLAACVDEVKALLNTGRVLISLDAGWYHVGEAGGGSFRSYDYFFTTFLPALSKAGVPERSIRQLTCEAPALALQPSIKRL